MTRAESTESPAFRRLGGWVLQYRFPLLALNLALTGWLLSEAPQLITDTSYKAMMISASEEARVQERLEDRFGVDAVFMVVVQGDVFSLPYLEKLKALQEEIRSLDMELASLGKRDLRDAAGRILVRARDRSAADTPAPTAGLGDFGDEGGWGDEEGGSIVDEIVSILNARDTRFQDDGLLVEGLFEQWPPSQQELAEKKAHALSRKSMVGHVVGAKGRHSVILVRTDFMDSEDSAAVDLAIRGLAEKYESDDFRIRFSGIPALTSELNRWLIQDVGVMNVLAFLCMLLLLGWIFRHPLGALGPVLVVAQACIWTVGAMAIGHVPMTVIGTILPSFLICVGIGDSVHMLSVYRQRKARHGDNRLAIVDAIAHTGRPVLFTTLTTCAGLLSFRFATLDAIRDFGLFGAMGVLSALVESLVFLPILLSFAPKGRFGLVKEGRETSPLSAWVLQHCNRISAPVLRGEQLSHRRRNRVLWLGVVLLGLAGYGTSLARVHHNPLEWLPPGGQARDAVAMLDGHVGGSSDIQLLIEAKPGRDLRDRETMLRLARLEEHILAFDGEVDGKRIVRTSTGLLDVVRETWWALKGEQSQYYAVPDSPRGVVDVFTLFESSSPEDLRRLMTVDAQTGLMVVRMLWVNASAYIPLAHHIEEGVRDIMGDHVTVHSTGTVNQAIQSDNAILGDLVRSFSIAIVVITLLMVLVLGSLRLGLIAMVPNVLPIVAVLAFMGFSGIGIDMSNLLIASIGISIAVDDTIHFLHHFRAHYASHGDREQAIANAFHRAGSAMISTSLVLLAGFVVFLAANLKNLIVFGLLIALTVAFALLIDLIFTPALLRLTFPAQRPPKP